MPRLHLLHEHMYGGGSPRFPSLPLISSILGGRLFFTQARHSVPGAARRTAAPGTPHAIRLGSTAALQAATGWRTSIAGSTSPTHRRPPASAFVA